MKTYISGRITGLEISEAFSNFEIAELELKNNGHEPVNVMKLFRNIPDWEWKDYMIADIKVLFECEAIYMQRNYQESKGAKIEHSIASHLGLIIYYEGMEGLDKHFKECDLCWLNEGGRLSPDCCQGTNTPLSAT